MRKYALKTIAAVTAVALTAGTFSGCADSGKQEEEFSPKLDTQKKVSLEIAGSVGNFEALDAVVNNFNELYPNVSISYEQYNSSKLKEYMDSNRNVDIIMTGDDQLRYPDFTDKYVFDYCADLSKEDINLSAVRDDMLKCYTIDGKLVSLPIAIKTSGMAVNETLLEKEGLSVPKNYSEFLDVLKALKDKGYTPIQGSVLQVYSYVVYNAVLDLIGTDPDFKNQLDSGSEEAYNKLYPIFAKLGELIDNGYTDNTVNSEYPEDNYDGAILKFFEGNVPFWMCDTEKFSGMKKRESKSEAFSATPFEYSFRYVPLGDKGAYEYGEPWSGFSINKNSDEYEYAVEFIRFLATEEQINTIASVKGMPSVANNNTDERYGALKNDNNAQLSYTNDGTVINHYKDYVASAANKLGTGEFKSTEDAVRFYIDECVKVAKNMQSAQ